MYVYDFQQRLLQRPTSTRKPIQTKSTTSTSVTSISTGIPKLEIYTASRNKNENHGPTSSFDDLLESFQTEVTTTRRPQLTTFSDADDIAFLKGLVRIKTFIFCSWFILFLFIDFFLLLVFYVVVNFFSLSNWIIAKPIR